jgi:hypothetical protein
MNNIRRKPLYFILKTMVYVNINYNDI